MRKRKLSILLLVMLVFFTACAKSASNEKNAGKDLAYPQEGSSNQYYDQDYSDHEEYDVDKEAKEDGGLINNSSAINNTGIGLDIDNKIIKRYELQLETKEFDKLINNINTQVTSLRGYVESSKISGRRYSYNNLQSGHLIVRIPKKSTDAFLNNINENANVIERSEYSENVTLQYVDAEGRKKSLEVQYERVLEILTKTDNLSEILVLEERLNNLRYEIERYGSSLRVYDNLVEFTTITLAIEEVKEITPLKEKDETVIERLSEGFSDSVLNIINAFTEFIILFVIAIPYLIILFAILVGVYFIMRKRKKIVNKED